MIGTDAVSGNGNRNGTGNRDRYANRYRYRYRYRYGYRLPVLLFGLLAKSPDVLHAQTQICGNKNTGDAHCNAALHAATVVQPALAIAAAGGNPLAGASSTLGMRIGKVPRISLSTRVTGAFVKVPDVAQGTSSGTDGKLFRSINVDFAVGLLSGWAIAPTVGGFGSLDLLGSIGSLSAPDPLNNAKTTYAIGARVGILRESFTAPGVSVTAMYRQLGDLSYGDPTLQTTDAYYSLRRNRDLSVRAVVGKRLFVLGANAGVGFDRVGSDPGAGARGQVSFPIEGFERITRTYSTGFASLTWTALILNAVLEGGAQKGDDATNYYATLAVRLAL